MVLTKIEGLTWSLSTDKTITYTYENNGFMVKYSDDGIGLETLGITDKKTNRAIYNMSVRHVYSGKTPTGDVKVLLTRLGGGVVIENDFSKHLVSIMIPLLPSISNPECFFMSIDDWKEKHDSKEFDLLGDY